jgi:hypothetical protein
VTKGDANNYEDSPVPAYRVFGKKTLTIPKVGLIFDIIWNNLIVYVILAAAIIFFLLTVRYFFGAPPNRGERAWET